jgi:NADH dehydrogenase [ubiquinone] 1 alpha subcomplex assembly factor 1
MMKYLICALFMTSFLPAKMLFDFNKKADIREWRIVDDVVMGGRSSGSFFVNKDGFGVFQGIISLENYGGFSSVRYRTGGIEVKDYTKVEIRLKGDGKKYQFRVRANDQDYYSYITTFSTSGKWETVEIPLEDLYPSFRGRRLRGPNFSGDSIEEITFLIGNKKPEEFKLLIDKIELI